MNFVLILLLLAITLLMGISAYQITSDQIINNTDQDIQAIANAQKTAIDGQIKKYLDYYYLFKLLVSSVLANEKQRDLSVISDISEQQISSLFRQSVVNIQLLIHADILDLNQKVIISSNATLIGETVPKSSFLEEGFTQPVITDPYFKNGKIYIDVIGPINNEEGLVIGQILLNFNADELTNITCNYTNLGDTGETLLGVRHGNDLTFLTPLRFQSDYSRLEPIEISGNRSIPMIKATAGQSGLNTALDYRSVPVVAAYYHIPITHWGLVVKIDEDEVLAGVRQLQYGLILSLLFVLLVGIFITLPLVSNFIRPLKEIEETTQKIINGDLNARVPVRKLDEIGKLGIAFNHMTEKLQKNQQDLIRQNEELSSFVYAVSHDLKAPLRGIFSLAQWLKEDLGDALNSDQKDQMRLLQERVNRMDALIDGLLNYSRIDRVKNPLVRVEVQVLVEKIIASMIIPEQFEVIIHPGLPFLFTDEIQILQVFQNLIDNAIKYHPGPHGRIEISCNDLTDCWEFSVKDDGNGIHPAYHEKIFKIFQTLQTNNRPGSTGIGLALVKKIIETNNGTIRVNSKGIPGEGVEFIFTWPKFQEENQV